MVRQNDARKEGNNARLVRYGSDGGSKKTCVRVQIQKS